jgi:hypothetical protein
MTDTKAKLEAIIRADSPQTDEDLVAQSRAQSERAAAIMAAQPTLPFISAYIMAGDQLSAERAERWMDAGADFLDVWVFVGSYARLGCAIKAQAAGRVGADWLLDNLPWLWSGSDPDDTDPTFLSWWKTAYIRNGGTVLDGEPLPGRGPILLHRGQDADAPLGIAWTTDKAVAEKFARGAGIRQSNRAGTVITTWVERSDILAYLTGRGESECIIDPRKPKKCWRHSWMAVDNQTRTECTRCGKAAGLS